MQETLRVHMKGGGGPEAGTHPPGRPILDPKFGLGKIKFECASPRGTHPLRPRTPLLQNSWCTRGKLR